MRLGGSCALWLSCETPFVECFGHDRGDRRVHPALLREGRRNRSMRRISHTPTLVILDDRPKRLEQAQRQR